MGQIVTLDQNMVNMIAAGEVIERPASVVKELMENSIDAGATNIVVKIEDGGRKLISVTDNGFGMDGEDLGRAFESHTTSKIKTSKDLRGISTLGFRGEALASIASIAQVRAVSRVKDSAGANCIEIDCGKKGQVSPCSADYGTTIQIRDIFYKLPGRRKFLKTTNTEMTHITEQFTRIALANACPGNKPNLDMTLIHNGREIYRLLGKEDIRQKIAELFSSEIAENLIETSSIERTQADHPEKKQKKSPGLHVFALLGRGEISRTTSKFQYIFLNGRFIRDKFISHAIKEAYRPVLEPNRFPVIFLFIQMPPEDFDVNVHPTKIEVRFYNANLIHSQILACLREKLLATNLQLRAKLPAAESPIQLSQQERIYDAMAEFFKKHRPVQTQRQINFRTTGPKAKSESFSGKPAAQITYPKEFEHKFLQIHNSFIVTETDEGFVIIDQHALHERIIYEDLRRRIRKANLQSQKLLIPESFEVTDSQADALQRASELIEKLGIELAAFGPKTVAIQAFPILLAKLAPLDFIRDLIDLLDRSGGSSETTELLDEILNMAACKAAVKAGQKLSDAEIEQLLADREIIETSSRCPHGRPTTLKFSITELEKQFKRTPSRKNIQRIGSRE